MASVLLVEGVAVLRVRRRLGQAAPAAGDGRGHRAVAALGSSVVGARGPVPCLAATDVPPSRRIRVRMSMKARLHCLPQWKQMSVT